MPLIKGLTLPRAVATLVFIGAPAMAQPIQLRCDNLSQSQPNPANYSILQIELDKSFFLQINHHASGSNKVPFKIIAANETMITAVSNHEGLRKMQINRTTGRVEQTRQYRSVTLSSGQVIPGGVINTMFECKPLKPLF